MTTKDLKIYVPVIHRELTSINLENGDENTRWALTDMVPDASGVTVDKNNWEKGDTWTVPITWNRATNVYDINQLQLAILLQESIDKQIYQARLITPNKYPQVIAGNPEVELSGWKIYPNPVEDKMTLNFGTELTSSYKCFIYNEMGMLMKQIELKAGFKSQDITLGNLSSGVYVIQISSENTVRNYHFVKVGSK